VRGYLRDHNPLTANQLVHITGYGDFSIDRIEGRQEEIPVFMTEKEKKMSRAASKAASKIGSRRGSIDAGTNGMGTSKNSGTKWKGFSTTCPAPA